MLKISHDHDDVLDSLLIASARLSSSNTGKNAPTAGEGDGGKKGRTGGEKFGIAVGVILLIVAVGAGAYFGFRYFQSKKKLSFQKYDNNPNAG